MKEKIGWVVIAVVAIISIVIGLVSRGRGSDAKILYTKNIALLEEVRSPKQLTDVTDPYEKITKNAYINLTREYRRSVTKDTDDLIDAMIRKNLFTNEKEFGSPDINRAIETSDDKTYPAYLEKTIFEPVERLNKLAETKYEKWFKAVYGAKAPLLAIPKREQTGGGWIPTGIDFGAAMGSKHHRRNMFLSAHLYRILREVRKDIDVKMFERATEETPEYDPDEIIMDEVLTEERGKKEGVASFSSEKIKAPRSVRAVNSLVFFTSSLDDSVREAKLDIYYKRQSEQLVDIFNTLLPEGVATPTVTFSGDNVARNVVNMDRVTEAKGCSFPGQWELNDLRKASIGGTVSDAAFRVFADRYMYETSGMLLRILVDPEAVGTVLDKLEGNREAFEAAVERRGGDDWVTSDGALKNLSPAIIPPLPYFGEIVSLNIIRAADFGFDPKKWEEYVKSIREQDKLDKLGVAQRLQSPGPVFLQVEMRFFWLNVSNEHNVLKEFARMEFKK